MDLLKDRSISSNISNGACMAVKSLNCYVNGSYRLLNGSTEDGGEPSFRVMSTVLFAVGLANRCGKMISAMKLRNSAQVPQGMLNALGECLKALAKAQRDGFDRRRPIPPQVASRSHLHEAQKLRQRLGLSQSPGHNAQYIREYSRRDHKNRTSVR